MQEAHIYQPPEQTSNLPASLLAFFDGKDLSHHVGHAVEVLTVDANGRPHSALLSPGEILATDAGHLRFAISPQSSTTANIEANGQLTFALVHEGKRYEVQLSAAPAGAITIGHNNAAFTARVEAVKAHSVPYADLKSGTTYTLKDPDAVLSRWRQQIEALRALT